MKDAEINREGAAALAELPEMQPILPAELSEMLRQGVTALDVRPGDQFAAGHVPGSINIALSGQFATWAGTLLGLSSRPVLIADSSDQLSEARMRLARVGIESERGYLEGGVDAWKQAGLAVATMDQMSVQELHEKLPRGGVRVLDVRR